MTIQTSDDNTDIKWLYRHKMTIQTLNIIYLIKCYTFNLMLYRHLMTIQTLNVIHLIKYYTFN